VAIANQREAWQVGAVDVNLGLPVITDTGSNGSNPQYKGEEPVNSGQLVDWLLVTKGRRLMIPK